MGEGWLKNGSRRRCLLLALTLVPSVFAARTMYSLLPTGEMPFLNLIVALLFALLFTWVSMGFWSATAGLGVLLFRYNRFVVTADLPAASSLSPNARAAILFPVYNEDASRVIEGVRTVWHSLGKTGFRDNFDIFILSDSTEPDAWINEELAWNTLCDDEDAHDRIFYRHRKINRKGKSGNVADFCRRWGANYPYMIVFDADSLMSGDTLVKMLHAMEARPDIGILQTTPKSINSKSLIARVQQFSNHLYGPVFAAGLHYWQLGDAQYWGHNAIIRTVPFIENCHLPVLSGPKPLGGPILSHDFVEAALMRRAGYSVWLAYELDGSYEENPPSLVDELVRDRRWCQGNLQHSKLVLARGFFPTHRALFINGIMSYFSALLWFVFLVVGSVQAVAVLFRLPVYFPEGPSLLPTWPQYFTGWMLALFSGTAMLLFLPKLLTLCLVLCKTKQSTAFGGRVSLIVSATFELVLSALLAPVRMLYHSLFVITTLLGMTVRWNAQNRDNDGTSWRQAIRFHWWGVVLGIVWGGIISLLNPHFFFWLSPIIAGLAISIPLSVWTSRTTLGQFAMRLHLFLTPADTQPTEEIRELNTSLESPAGKKSSAFAMQHDFGFIRAVVAPEVLQLHVSLASQKPIHEVKASELDELVVKALQSGPNALTREEKTTLLRHPIHLTGLHYKVWSLDDASAWGIV